MSGAEDTDLADTWHAWHVRLLDAKRFDVRHGMSWPPAESKEDS